MKLAQALAVSFTLISSLNSQAASDIQCREAIQSQVKLHGAFKVKSRDYYLLTACHYALREFDGSPVSPAMYQRELQECRGRLKEERVAPKLISEMLSDKLIEVTADEETPSRKGSDGFHQVTSFNDQYLLDEMTEGDYEIMSKDWQKSPDRKELLGTVLHWESPRGEKIVFSSRDADPIGVTGILPFDLKVLTQINSNLDRLAFSPDPKGRKSFQDVPTVVQQILGPHIRFPQILTAINRDNATPTVVVTVIDFDRSGKPFVAGQKSYSLRGTRFTLPEKSYLKGALRFSGSYTFTCQGSPFFFF